MNYQTYLEVIIPVLGVVLPVLRQYILTRKSGLVASVARGAYTAVRAAEKLGQDVPGTTGAAKLNFASEVVVAGAKRLGIKLTDDEVLAFVHAALVDFQKVRSAPALAPTVVA